MNYIIPIPKWVDLMVAGHARRRRGLDLVAAQAALDQHGHISRAAAAIGSYRKALQDRIDSGDLIKRVTPHPRTRSFDMAAAQKMLYSGASYNATGAEVGVSAGLIQKMIVRGALSSPHRRGPKRRTTLDEIETIAALLADGWPNKDIAAATGVRPATISYLISAGRVARPERTGKRPRRP